MTGKTLWLVMGWNDSVYHFEPDSAYENEASAQAQAHLLEAQYKLTEPMYDEWCRGARESDPPRITGYESCDIMEVPFRIES